MPTITSKCDQCGMAVTREVRFSDEIGDRYLCYKCRPEDPPSSHTVRQAGYSAPRVTNAGWPHVSYAMSVPEDQLQSTIEQHARIGVRYEVDEKKRCVVQSPQHQVELRKAFERLSGRELRDFDSYSS